MCSRSSTCRRAGPARRTPSTRRLRHARGQWLWFFDADTIHAPESLSIVMEYGRSEGAALVSLLPELKCETFWEKVVQPLAAITLMQSFPLHVVNDDRSRLAFANGQYILIERTAYEAAGGHRAVRERFVEDIGMAEHVKALGLPIRVALVRGLVSVPDVLLVPPARPRLEPHPLRRARPQDLAPRAQAARSDHLLPERPPGPRRSAGPHGARAAPGPSRPGSWSSP